LRLDPVPAVRSEIVVRVASEERAAASRQFARSIEAGKHPAIVMHGRKSHPRTGGRAGYWRDPRNARQAFVASLVFGPPKGLES